MAGRMSAAAVILTIAAVRARVRPPGALLLACLPRNARREEVMVPCVHARVRVCVCVRVWAHVPSAVNGCCVWLSAPTPPALLPMCMCVRAR